MKIDVYDAPLDSLSRERWTFWLYDHRVVFDAWAHEVRASTRHKFRPAVVWSRLYDGTNPRRMYGAKWVSRPPVPAAIRDRAMKEAATQLVFVEEYRR